MKTSILLARLVIVVRSRFASIGICMRVTFWLLGHLKMMENILYGLQGRCQIRTLTRIPWVCTDLILSTGIV